MRRVNLTTLIFHTYGVGVFAVNSCMTSSRAVATKSNAVAVVNGVSDLTTPHTLLGVTSMLFSNAVAERGADLLDPRSRERGSDVQRGIDVAL